MKWRRVAEVLRLHHALKLMDEREARARHLALARATIVEQTAGVRDMEAQSRLGSYRRVRIGR